MKVIMKVMKVIMKVMKVFMKLPKVFMKLLSCFSPLKPFNRLFESFHDSHHSLFGLILIPLV